METLAAEVQMALLTGETTPKSGTTVVTPDWTKPIRAESMTTEDVLSQLIARDLDSKGTDSELVDRLQAVLDIEQSEASATKRTLFDGSTNEVFFILYNIAEFILLMIWLKRWYGFGHRLPPRLTMIQCKELERFAWASLNLTNISMTRFLSQCILCTQKYEDLQAKHEALLQQVEHLTR